MADATALRTQRPRSRPPLTGREVLLVEDEKLARSELTRALRRKGLTIRQASSGRTAIRQARLKNIGLVLMDIELGDELDGIEAARRIQEERPKTKIIFVTAYAGNLDYRRRVQKSNIRVCQWIEKPVQPALSHLVKTISKELDDFSGFEQRGAAAKAPAKKKQRDAYVQSPEMPLATAIYSVYEEMRAVISGNAGKAGLREALLPLRERLRVLQVREAEEIAKRYDTRFGPLYDEGQSLILRARQLLEDE
jgi:CheY-like chemotaxis protein